MMTGWTETYTFLDGEWFEGNPPILGPRTHAFWLGSSVFDGARAFEGVTPDLDRHCARLNRSAKTMWLKPTMSREAIERTRPRRDQEVRAGRRALYPADVLGRAQRPRLGAARSGIDALLPVDLRGAAARSHRRLDHPLALSQAARR